LSKAYPTHSQRELKRIEKGYYKHLCDLLVEFWKQLTASSDFINKHVQIEGIEKIHQSQKGGKSVMLVMGHVNSWEWAMQKIGLNVSNPFYVLYRPLSNQSIDQLVLKVRTKFGINLIGMSAIVRFLMTNRDRTVGGCFIADQNPPKKNALWSDFLRRETAFFSGFQKLAKKFNHEVYFLEVTKTKRGYYTGRLELLVKEPKEMSEEEMTHLFAKRLEKQIDAQPESWLWSHRRWKYTK